MAVHACIKQNQFNDNDDDDDDDSRPISFKRKSSASKAIQTHSETEKSLSRRHELVSTVNGENSIMQKSKIGSSTKASRGKLSEMGSPGFTSCVDKLPKQNAVSPDMEKLSNGSHIEQHDESDDSDDEKPLSVTIHAGLSKSNSHHVSKRLCSPTPSTLHSAKTKISSENIVDDSEDDIPLALKFQSTAIVGLSTSKSPESMELIPATTSSSKPQKFNVPIKDYNDDSEDELLFALKFRQKTTAGTSSSKSVDVNEKNPSGSNHQNETSMDDSQLIKYPKGRKKRSKGEDEIKHKSSAKKPKLFYTSTNNGVKQASVKLELKTDDDDVDNIPIAKRMKKSSSSNKKSASLKKKTTKVVSSSFKNTTKKSKKSKKLAKSSKYSKSSDVPPTSADGKKWTTLEHYGVIFTPPYKPHGVKMLYDGNPVDLTPEQEEVATMFAVMVDTTYAAEQRFIENFMNDWRKLLGKDHVIKKFDLCNFGPIYEWHQREKEKKKQITKEEKKALKEEKLKREEKYKWAVVDGVKEEVENFTVEPPGLFRGRGEHPKKGKLKKRILPSDITINIGKDAPIPECPIPGERWKEIKHDNTGAWLANWNDPVNPKSIKYVKFASSSSLKRKSDKAKYEKARLLKDYIGNIRTRYTKDFTSEDLTKRQIAVATYLIDKLALRAGNEKDVDEADTVGCCTLKVKNVRPISPNKLEFDFLGKDSIKYFNVVEVELPVFEAIAQFKAGKKKGDDLFDKLDTSKLNAHLKELMPHLTAKVFRTYNASFTLDETLARGTKDGDVAAKVVAYQHANKEVAILCNHQRSVSKSHDTQMSKMTDKITELKGVLDGLKTDLTRTKKGKPRLEDSDGKPKTNLTSEGLERKIAQTNSKIEKLERDMKTKEDLKTVALGTSKINYCDPRISVAWCKRHEVPIEKIFNKSLLDKFAWAMDVDPSFRF